MRPIVWSRAWRGHLWHARQTLAAAGSSIVDDPTAACGFRPGDGQRPGRVSTWSGWRCQWAETIEREPEPTRRDALGNWVHDLRCSGCVAALHPPGAARPNQTLVEVLGGQS